MKFSNVILALPILVLSSGSYAADPYLQNKLVKAAGACDLSRVKQLLAEGASISEPDEWGKTPLYSTVDMAAVRLKVCRDVFEFLTVNGADPNNRLGSQHYGGSVLSKAFEELLSSGYRIHAMNSGVETAEKLLDQKKTRDRLAELVEFMISLPKIDLNYNVNTSPLFQALDKFDVIDLETQQTVNRLIKKMVLAKADVNLRTGSMQTPLMAACRSANIEAVKLLIEHGAKVDAQDHGGATAMAFIIQNMDHPDIFPGNFPDIFPPPTVGLAERVEIADILVKNGASLTSGSRERSLMRFATIFRIDNAIKYLLSRGISPAPADCELVLQRLNWCTSVGSAESCDESTRRADKVILELLGCS